jgi:hypothetical protein
MKDGAMPPNNAHKVANEQKLTTSINASGAWDYCPRRDVPETSTTLSNVSPDPNHNYFIIHREPGDTNNPMPIYTLQDSRIRDATYIRVSLIDIEQYVSPRELESYENSRFANNDPEFSSKRAWLEAKKLNPFSKNLIPKSRTVQVIVKSRPVFEAEAYEIETYTPEGSPPQQNFMKSPIKPPPFQREGVVDRARHESETPQETDGAIKGGDDEETDTNYEVSHILEERDVLGRVYYLVAWKGLPDGHATWLTIDELSDLGFVESDTSPE